MLRSDNKLQLRSKRRAAQKNKMTAVNPLLRLLPAFPGQVTFQCPLIVGGGAVLTTVTTGVAAVALAISAGEVNGWAARFGSTFEEFRITRCTTRLRMFSSTNPGVLTCWYDEKNTGAPTLNESESKPRLVDTFPCSSVDQVHKITWVPSDPLDLQYTATSTTSVVPVTFKVYTNAADWGAPIVATQVAHIDQEYIVQFRGMHSQ